MLRARCRPHQPRYQLTRRSWFTGNGRLSRAVILSTVFQDYLFRLSLEGLKKLEEVHWPAQEDGVETCLLRGKSQTECHNYVKVLVQHNERLFTCGTNAYKPECSWREINSLQTVIEWVDGDAKCPCSSDANSTALMTSNGDYYIASTLDFTGQNSAICRIMGNGPPLKTMRFHPKWLSEPDFVASYEMGNFISSFEKQLYNT